MMLMNQAQHVLEVSTPGRGLHEITGRLAAFVRESGIKTGLLTAFITHTSASLVIQENADPSARKDLEDWLVRLAPDGDPNYTHTAEGPDDMPAHLRGALTSTSENIPVVDGELALGTWQGVFLAEHRLRGHSRRVVLHLMGE
jgi:secondary thiamine-phosphate synthase enzyme